MTIRTNILAGLTALVLGACGGPTTSGGQADGAGDLVIPDGSQAEVDQFQPDLGPDQLPPKDAGDVSEVSPGDLSDGGDLTDLGDTQDAGGPDADPDGAGPDVPAAPLPPRFLLLGNHAGAGFMRTGSLSLTFQIGPSSAGQMRSPNARLVGPVLLLSR